MAVSDSAKVDLLYKKLFGVAKTDTPTNKGPSNESIASPAMLRGDTVWTQASSIPATAAAVTGVVSSYNGSSKVQCTADNTSVPISSVYPTWKTGLTDWIPPEFGSTYFVKVYVDNSGATDPSATGTQIFDSGSGGTGEWNFDYVSGVLNFIGGTIPTVLTSSKVIYVMGYRYIGSKGVTNLGNITISGNSLVSSSGNISLGNISIQNTTISSLVNDIHLNPLLTTSRVVFDNTSAITIPKGDSSSRPGTPVAGDLRYNTTTAALEYYNGAGWMSTTANIDSQVFNGDGVNSAFTLNNAATNNSILVSINGTLQQPTTAYTASGTTLTFVETPLVGDVIEVRYIALTVTSSQNFGIVDTANVTVSTSTVTIDSFDPAVYRSADYKIQVSNGTDYQLSTVGVIHNGANSFITVSSTLTNGNIATFSSTFGGGFCNLRVTASSTSTIRIKKTYFTI